MNNTTATPTISAHQWPYPAWVAHRGAGKLAPENTLAAFRVGAQHGYRMFECDVKLSQDGVAFLLHDNTLERTTNGQGIGGEQPWAVLSQLEAGAWHSRLYAGESLPTLGAVAKFCQTNGLFLNIEIKPTEGDERHTGEEVAKLAARLWHGQSVPPLLSSFQIKALEGAQATTPQLPRGLLLENLKGKWLATAQRLACVAVICDHHVLTAHAVKTIQAAGMKALCYTANEPEDIARLQTMGIDGIITDRVDRFAP
jgi:glycerophosphoryl diester phosphodiesterase